MGFLASFLENAQDHIHDLSTRFGIKDIDQDTWVISFTLLVMCSLFAFVSANVKTLFGSRGTLPPTIPHIVPFLGSMIAYGVEPIKFLMQCKEKYGDCFTFTLFGRNMTFCLGPDGNNFVFNVKLNEANAEMAYETLTVPVFGKDVVYDVPNALFMEQKKFLKDHLSTAAFREYVPIFIREVKDFMKTWSDKDDKFLVHHIMAELTIRTSSHTLMGPEIRSKLSSKVAKLYKQLDDGFAPINVFFRWLPLPSYINRDRAHKEMVQIFADVINERRKNKTFDNVDILQGLMDAKYKNGESLPDHEIAHLLIALLMAGQHTSSTTTTWMFSRLAENPELVKELLEEQSMILTGKPNTPANELPDFDYDQLKEFTLLDCVMKETLRLHQPIHTIMRVVTKELTYKGLTIPPGHFLCAAPAVSHIDPIRFPDPLKFDPKRHINSDEGNGEWTINGVDITQKSAKSHFLPFGAGRHRCIGEAFAFIQVKSIISVILRDWNFDLPMGKDGEKKFPGTDFTSLIVMPQNPAHLVVTRK